MPAPLSAAARRFTLLELVVTIALASIIASIGWVSTRDQLPRYRLQKAAKLMRNDVELVRHEAIFRGKEARLVLRQSGGTCDPETPAVGAWLLQIGDQPTGSTKREFPADAGRRNGRRGRTGTIDSDRGRPRREEHLPEDWGDPRPRAEPGRDRVQLPRLGAQSDDDYTSGFIGLTLVNTDARATERP